MAKDRDVLFTFIAAFALGAVYMYLKSKQSTVPSTQPAYTGYQVSEHPSIDIEGVEEEVVISNTEEVKPEFDEKGRIVGMIITREVKRVSG